MGKLRVFLSSAMTGELDRERDALRLLFKTDPLLREFSDLYAIEQHASPQPIEKAFVDEVKDSDVLILLLDKQIRDAVRKEFKTSRECSVRPFVFIRKRTDQREKDLDEFISNEAFQFHCGSFFDPFDLCPIVRQAIIDDVLNFYCRNRLDAPRTSLSDSYIVPGNGPDSAHYLFDNKDISTALNDDEIARLSSDQLLSLGMQLCEQWDFRRALLFVELAIIRDSTNWMAFHNKGHLLSEIGLSDESIFYYRKALDINPESHPTLHNIGVFCYRKGEYEKAEEYFKKALSKLPSKQSSLSYLVNICLLKQRNEEALEYANRAAEGQATELDLGNLALCLALNNRTDEAMVVLERMNKSEKEYLRSLALIEDSRDNIVAALELLEKYFSEFGYEYYLTIKKAYYLLSMDRLDEFRKWIEFLDGNLQISAEDYNNLGYELFCTRRDIETSVLLFKRATELDPRSVPAWKNLQSALVELGDLEQGISVSEEALLHYPNDPGIVGNMSLFLLKSGRLLEYTELLMNKSVDFFGFNLSEDQKEQIIEQVKAGIDVVSLESLQRLINPLK